MAALSYVEIDAGATCRRREGALIDPAFTLEKKTAIVVGAANGIGRSTALAAAGAGVACADAEKAGAASAFTTGSDLLIDRGYTAIWREGRPVWEDWTGRSR